MFWTTQVRQRFLLATIVSLGSAWSTHAAEPTYRQDRDFLAMHTRVVELVGDDDVRVVVCPEFQGRVMTSTCGGEDGPSFGWINREFIAAGSASDVFNNYGGEDRFWLGPEGGQFGLWFKPGEEQKFANWHTPTDLNTGAFNVMNPSPTTFCLMSRHIIVKNASDKEFDIDVVRGVRVLGRRELGKAFGQDVVEAADGVEMVGFKSDNKLNDHRSNEWTDEGGLISIWILGMFPPGERTVVMLPYRTGSEAELGPVVNTGYFAEPPENRLRVLPEAVLFLADGNLRGKIGLTQRRAKDVIGSIDFERGILTLVHLSMPDDPTGKKYVNNFWDVPQAAPFVGDVVNSYNDGPPEPGMKNLGGFYELETMSPTIALGEGQNIKHEHMTYHFRGSRAQLAKLAKAALGVNLDTVEQKMFAEPKAHGVSQPADGR